MHTYPGVSRRSLLRASIAATALTMFRPVRALSSTPRQRVILDNDFSGDPDGLFQLAHHLASPSVEIPLVIGSHIHINDFLDKTTTQPENAVAKVQALYATMKLERRPRTVAGRASAPRKGEKPDMTEAARQIIAEAQREDTELPLFYCAGAGLTDLATALTLEPRIAKRLTLVWIGGMEYADPLPGSTPRRGAEYNLTIDLSAAQWIFNHSKIEIWQVPRNVYRQLNISRAELVAGLRPAGKLGTFLSQELDRVQTVVKANLGETYVLGDSPLVTLTALQSAFEPDTSSSAYVVRPTPNIADDGRYAMNVDGRPMRVYQAIDTRLTFADMFAKFAAFGR